MSLINEYRDKQNYVKAKGKNFGYLGVKVRVMFNLRGILLYITEFKNLKSSCSKYFSRFKTTYFE